MIAKLEELWDGASPQETIWKVNEIIRAVNDTQRPPWISIVDELPRHSSESYGTRELEDIKQIVIHHTGVKAEVPPENTARYCVNVRDWPGMPYHFYIMRDGTAYKTQYLSAISYHCYGNCNTISVAVCLEGSFMYGRQPTTPQLIAANRVVDWLVKAFDLPVIGHKDVPRSTSCPGTTWPLWRDKILPSGNV